VVLLCRTGGGLVFLEPVAVALEVDDVSVVDDSVDQGRGDGQVSEDVAPAGEWEVGRQDHGGVFVAAGDELEERVRGVLFNRDVADFINYEEPVAAQFGEFLSVFPRRWASWSRATQPVAESKRTRCPALAALMPMPTAIPNC
jgi:hypothetical protein